MEQANKKSASDLTTLYLNDACHTTNFSAEITCALSNKFLGYCDEKQINIPDYLGEGQRFCKGCKVIFISGWNVEIRVAYERCKAERRRKRVLKYRCLNCKTTNRHDCLVQQSEAKTLEDDNVDRGKEFKASWPPGKTEAKKRSKKRKQMGNLSSLLQQRKSQEENKKSSLSLMDFLGEK